MGAQGESLHLAVRASGDDAGAGDAGQRRGVRTMPIIDKRLWRVIEPYVAKAITRFDLSSVEAVGLDEIASKRGHNQVTVFIDMQRRKEPVLFSTSGKRQEDVEAVCAVSADTQGIAPDVAHFDSLSPSEALISLHTTEKQCLVAHNIYLIINKLVLRVCEVGKGSPEEILEVACDMSSAFLSGIDEALPNAEVTVDWFHIVQPFIRTLDQV